jgi:hypothetical protein
MRRITKLELRFERLQELVLEHINNSIDDPESHHSQCPVCSGTGTSK